MEGSLGFGRGDGESIPVQQVKGPRPWGQTDLGLSPESVASLLCVLSSRPPHL